MTTGLQRARGPRPLGGRRGIEGQQSPLFDELRPSKAGLQPRASSQGDESSRALVFCALVTVGINGNHIGRVKGSNHVFVAKSPGAIEPMLHP
jgi:hypothetical protein